MSAYKVSVVLLTYNRSALLPSVVDAILSQTYTQFEFIVIDNGSTDETPAVMMRLQTERIKYVRLPIGSNAADSFLNALRMASGTLVLVTHDDDLMTPFMLEKQVAAAESAPDIACVATNVQLIDERGVVIQPALYKMESDRIFRKNTYLAAYCQEKIWLPTPTLLFNRGSLGKALKREVAVDETDSVYQPSADIWIAAMLNTCGKLILLREPLLKYRQHPGQESRNVDQSAPMVTFARACLKTPILRKNNRRTIPNILGLYLKYKLQYLLFNTKDLKELRRGVVRISSFYRRARLYRKSLSECLPFEIMCAQLEITLGKARAHKRNKSEEVSPVNAAYRHWLAKLNASQLFFPKSLQDKKIAIFGSMLTAYLLVNEAKKNDFRVVGCFDSSAARIGSKVFGETIEPLDSLPAYVADIDVLILSNEREHGEAIATMLCEKYGVGQDKIMHWVDFARETSLHNQFDVAAG